MARLEHDAPNEPTPVLTRLRAGGPLCGDAPMSGVARVPPPDSSQFGKFRVVFVLIEADRVCIETPGRAIAKPEEPAKRKTARSVEPVTAIGG